MPTPNTSHAGPVSDFSPAAAAAAAVANAIDDLIESLARLGLAARTEVRLLTAIHGGAVSSPDWHRNDDVLATLQHALDLVYDLVLGACPVWSAGNANDLHVRAYALVIVLWALHRAQADRENGTRDRVNRSIVHLHG